MRSQFVFLAIPLMAGLLVCGSDAQAQTGSIIVGEQAPETVGVSLRNEMLDLEDYRGKVVVLYFWGSWCPPSRAMNPHIHALAKHLPEDAFAVIGVNSDPFEKIGAINANELYNWPNFQNELPDDGAIADTWDVKGWPGLVVIDPAGKIYSVNPQRTRNGSEKLNEVLAELLSESELVSEMQIEELFASVNDTADEVRQQFTHDR
ncbi:MAG: TlpA family protein disulfide reductase [Pirellulaceae bacterium]